MLRAVSAVSASGRRREERLSGGERPGWAHRCLGCATLRCRTADANAREARETTDPAPPRPRTGECCATSVSGPQPASAGVGTTLAPRSFDSARRPREDVERRLHAAPRAAMVRALAGLGQPQTATGRGTACTDGGPVRALQ